MFCSNCGREIPAGGNYCPVCGNMLVSAGRPDSSRGRMFSQAENFQPGKTSSLNGNVRRKSPKLGVWIAILSFAIIICLVGGLLFFFQMDGDSSYERKRGEEVAENEEDDAVPSETETEGGSSTEAEGSGETEEDLYQTVEEEPLSMSRCAKLRSGLLKGKPVKTSEQGRLMGMCDTALRIRELFQEGEPVLYQEIDGDERDYLDYYVAQQMFWGDGFDGILPHQEKNGYYYMKEEDLKQVCCQFYGRSMDVTIQEVEYGLEISGNGRIRASYGDGDAVTRILQADIYEKDEFYLVSGPCVCCSNDEGDGEIEFYADFLFQKDPESKLPARLVYSYAYQDEPVIKKVTATSHLKPSTEKTYTPDHLFDHDLDTVWCEGADGVGAGESVTILLKKKKRIHGIRIMNGYTASEDLYFKNGRVTGLKVIFGGKETVTQSLRAKGYDEEGYTQDIDGSYYQGESYGLWETVSCKENITTDKIVLKIASAKRGTKYADTCIAEVQIY